MALDNNIGSEKKYQHKKVQIMISLESDPKVQNQPVFAYGDVLKCQYASFMAQQFNKMRGTRGGNLFNDVFPEGLLAPTP